MPRCVLGIAETYMLRLTVARYDYRDDMTRGIIYSGGTHIGYSLENAWKNNRRNISCIPNGVYETGVRLSSQSASYEYDHLILNNVKNRSYILWHIGNYPSDTKGCILPGKTATPDMVGRSSQAFDEIMDRAKMADKIETKVTDINF